MAQLHLKNDISYEVAFIYLPSMEVKNLFSHFKLVFSVMLKVIQNKKSTIFQEKREIGS